MKQLIEDIINRFGGRLPGSKQERDAQLYLKSLLEKFCDSVRVQEFKTPVNSMFGSLKIFCVLFYASIVLFQFNQMAALVLSLINSVLFIGHFVIYHHWLDFLFKKHDSLNIIGDVEPLEKATSTVMISGHMDSTLEFIWWYRLKDFGVVLTVLSGFLIALFPFVSVLALVQEFAGWSFPLAQYAWWFFVIPSPITIVYFNIHGKNAVHGAQDNLSGIVVAAEVAKHFSNHKLTHTRVRIVSFGCEEPGLRGSDAYAKTFCKELKQENAVCINLDGIKDADKLTIVTAEPMVLAKYSPSMIGKLEVAFKTAGVPYLKKPVPIGATDGVSFQRQGIPVVSVIGLSTEKLDPTYHTRLDVPECVDPLSLELTRKAVVQFIETYDADAVAK